MPRLFGAPELMPSGDGRLELFVFCDKLFVPLLRDWEGFLVTTDDFVASGERVVSLGAYSGIFKATGKAMTAPFAHAWIVRGDRISRFIQYTDTVKIREALSP
jgi:ketosteroid isomerase-like protein